MKRYFEELVWIWRFHFPGLSSPLESSILDFDDQLLRSEKHTPECSRIYIDNNIYRGCVGEGECSSIYFLGNCFAMVLKWSDLQALSRY